MLNKYISQILIILTSLLALSCSSKKVNPGKSIDQMNWQEIVQQAQGQTVNLMMWQGDQNINQYMNQYVKPRLKEKYDINLEIAGGQGSTIASILRSELDAGVEQSELDMMWINGETFYQLRQLDALYGPFTSKLPNSKYVDYDDPFIKYDFQQKIDGYECPWGNVQFVLIYNSRHVEHPPRDMQELAKFVKRYPGKFTTSNDFTGMTLLKSFLVELAGPHTLDGSFNPDLYATYSSLLWKYLNRIKSDFWKQGETFPSGVAQMHQLYANGELYITMSNNDAEVDNKVEDGLFPKSSRGYVLDHGTIRNSHYMGIAKYAVHKAAAMVVANFLISPEAQYQKLKPDVWGDGTVLNTGSLPGNWPEKFRQISKHKRAPSKEVLHKHDLQELAPEYMIHLYEDFRTHVIQH